MSHSILNLKVDSITFLEKIKSFSNALEEHFQDQNLSVEKKIRMHIYQTTPVT